MDRNLHSSSVADYLDDVTEQIAYKPLRPSIRQELEAHIEDRIEECKSRGVTSDEAIDRTLNNMGDAVSIGTDLNAIHRLQKAPGLALAVALMFLAGFVLSLFLQGSKEELRQYIPDDMRNNFVYYIAGGTLFLLTAIKGYPFLIRKRKVLTWLAVIIYPLLLLKDFFWSTFINFWFNFDITDVATLLFIPLIAILLYCLRRNDKKFLPVIIGFLCVWMTQIGSSLYDSVTILLMSTLCTIGFMIHRHILPGQRKTLGSIAIIAAVILGSPLIMTSDNRLQVKNFFFPPAKAESWQDFYTYDSLLIQELLSKTPLTHGLSLTPEEMMNYGTGVWYFTSEEPDQIFLDASGLENEEQKQAYDEKVWNLGIQGYHPKRIRYTAEDVTLRDILPYHYTYYLSAVGIILFGWLPGLLLIGMVVLFYLLLFRYILRIHGHLASSLAFSCGQCLLWQGILYLLRNFGYGYLFGSFPSLPLISESNINIIFNMVLLGLIFSAYRYDHVMDEPLEQPVISPEQSAVI